MGQNNSTNKPEEQKTKAATKDCPVCNGSGLSADVSVVCETCNGSGKV